LADISSARQLGWTPQVEIREGLIRSIQYIQEKVLEAAKNHRPDAIAV
jgi:nucleoside-diphosphate-sugar epimerase